MPSTATCFRLPISPRQVCSNPAGAREMRDRIVPLKKFSLRFPGLERYMPNNGIDIAMNSVYPALRSYVSLPPLAVTPNDHAISSVQVPRTNRV